jgi:hypothetical protein
VHNLSQVILVCEDIIGINAKKYEVLNYVLTWMCHHDSIVPCYVIAHSILKTKIHSLLSSFTHIFLSADPSNAASFKRLLSYYSYEPHEKEQYIKRLNKCVKPYAHFKFTVRTRTIELVRFPFVPPESVSPGSDDDDDAAAAAASTSRPEAGAAMESVIQKRADRQKSATAFEKSRRFLSVGAVFKDRDRSDTALAIFDLVFPFLPLHKINANNLTITLKRNNVRGAYSEVVISIIDYICALVLESNSEPSAIICRFHKFVTETKRIKIPQVFIGNAFFHD